MIFSWGKKRAIFLLVMIAGLVITLVLVLGKLTLERTKRMTEQRIKNHLLHLQKPNWDGYAKLNKNISGLLKNWAGVSHRKAAGNETFEENGFIQTELDHQISEIKRISEIEETLKLSRLHETFQDYATKRRHYFNNEFQKNSRSMQESLQSDLTRKKRETAKQLHDFENGLISEQQLALVNLQLELALSDLKEKPQGAIGSYRKKVQAQITAIKLEIARKVAARKESVNKRLILYEQQRTDDIQQQLENLKQKLNNQLENDLAAFKENLTHNYDEWHQSQNEEFTKAIDTRQQEKKK